MKLKVKLIIALLSCIMALCMFVGCSVANTEKPGGNNAETTDPADPGTTDPTDPGTTDPTDPGTTDPTDPGTTDPTDPGTTDPTDPGTTDPTDPGTTDPTDPGTTDPTPAPADPVQYTGNESTLSIDTYSGGFGSDFLRVVAERFDAANKDKSYANGKKGVKIVVTENVNNNGSAFKNNVKNATSDVHVVEGIYYTDLLQDGSILNISDIMTATLSDGKTIEDKLNTEQQNVLKYNGKYYSIPTFAGFTGLTYNKKLFADNNLYFSNYITPPDDVISSYTGESYNGRPFIEYKTDMKSPGPDGIYNTEDDGLPSSYEEFFYLLDTMLELDIIPFISYPGHYTNYLFQELLCAASTADGLNAMFTFDSNGQRIEHVTGWSGDEPTTAKKTISQENGYLSTMEYSRYQALKFIKHLATYTDMSGTSYIHPDTWKVNTSNTAVQRAFLNSTIDPNATPIAMLNEGVYWYNESQSIRKSLGAKANNMDLGYMTLPAIETGTVGLGGGTTQLVADALNYYLVVNANIAGNAEKLAIAKDFIKFMYTDEMLQLMTVTTGIPFALDYDLEDEQYESMDKLSQSFWNIYAAAKDEDSYITCMSTSPIFMANTDRFSFKTTYNFYKSTVRGSETVDPIEYFHLHSDVTAREYFEGMSIDKTGWAAYNK